ncbi:unnamed protein product, partial [Amoebophrya sp. A120]|eukprot:GSA120T00021555001.1
MLLGRVWPISVRIAWDDCGAHTRRRKAAGCGLVGESAPRCLRIMARQALRPLGYFLEKTGAGAAGIESARGHWLCEIQTTAAEVGAVAPPGRRVGQYEKTAGPLADHV